MRWSMCVAYLVPPGFAWKLCQDVGRCKGRILKSPDLGFADYTKYFIWPPAFGGQGGTSRMSR
eukprot:9261737-Lingulodinium_polyedra.AAC.1